MHPHKTREPQQEYSFFFILFVPRVRRVRSPPRDFYFMYNIWQDARNRTQVAATAARCATNELHTSLVSYTHPYATHIPVPIYLSISPAPIYLSIYLSCSYLSIHLSCFYLSIYLSLLLLFISISLLLLFIYLSISPAPIYLSIYLSCSYLSIYLSCSYLSIYLCCADLITTFWGGEEVAGVLRCFLSYFRETFSNWFLSRKCYWGSEILSFCTKKYLNDNFTKICLPHTLGGSGSSSMGILTLAHSQPAPNPFKFSVSLLSMSGIVSVTNNVGCWTGVRRTIN